MKEDKTVWRSEHRSIGGNRELVWLLRLNQASLFELSGVLGAFVETRQGDEAFSADNVRLTGYVEVRERIDDVPHGPGATITPVQ